MTDLHFVICTFAFSFLILIAISVLCSIFAPRRY